MSNLWIDHETYSATDIKAGAHIYAQSAEVLITAYALDDGDVRVWDAVRGMVFVLADDLDGLPILEHISNTLRVPTDLAGGLRTATTITAHNAQFDRLITEHALGIVPALERWRCTMVQAYSHCYPGSLDMLCKLLGVPADQVKLDTGKKLINRFCKPAPSNHMADRYSHETHPAEWEQFLLYAALDIVAMREVAKRLPDWNWQQRDVDLWHLDQRINDRGIRIDRGLVVAGAAAAIAEKASLATEFVTLTGGHVDSPTKRAAFAAYLNSEFGLSLDNTRKDTLQPLVDDGDLEPRCQRLLEIALSANKTSTAKYAALLPMVDTDDRFRGALQFRGAKRTGRMAGRGFQGQNLPSRGLPKQNIIDGYVAALKGGIHDLLYDDLMLLGSAALRSCVVAPDGATLAIADLSNIEGRLAAYLSGERWKLDAFRAFDNGTGPDVYMLTAVGIVGGDPWDVNRLVPGRTEKVRNVFGKVPDLFGAYQGGYGAAQTFAKGSGLQTRDGLAFANYMDTILESADPALVAAAKANHSKWGAARDPDAIYKEWIASDIVKLAWRARHPATVKLWSLISQAMVDAIDSPGRTYAAGPCLRYVVRTWSGIQYLCAILPSGRLICYAEPRVHRDDKDSDRVTGITYMGTDATAAGGEFGKWQRLPLYGGKGLEQACQATAGDILWHSAPLIEAAGYKIVLSVHDEWITEDAPDRGDNGTELAALMSTVPAYLPGLPLAASGFTAPTYRK